MKFRNIIWSLMAALTLVACQEEDDTIEEYADWQATNDNYYNQLVAKTRPLTATDLRWGLLKSYTMSDVRDERTELPYSDYVVVERLEWDSSLDASAPSPLLTDSVAIHYQGRLLPSPSYPQGYLFDSSFAADFDPVTATPSKFAVSGLVRGFATALMYMHRGDRWRIYIPYQLAYGSTARSSIPAYSTLIFDVRLEDFWHKQRDDRE